MTILSSEALKFVKYPPQLEIYTLTLLINGLFGGRRNQTIEGGQEKINWSVEKCTPNWL